MKNSYALPLIAAGIGGLLIQKSRRRDRFNFYNRNVLVTGGSRGLGLALAREFAASGAHVTICGRNEHTLDQARVQLKKTGLQVCPAVCDVTQEANVSALIRDLEERNGPLDVLVNNAGRIEVGPLESTTVQDFEKAMATHFWGPLFLMRAVIPGMQQRRSGRIVNISSIGGKVGVPHLIPYDCSKFALAGLSEAVAAEVRKDGIRVTTVYPGLMRTGSPRNANFKGQNRKEYTWFAISDALPFVTVAATRAARKIVRACRKGRGSLTLSAAAQIASALHDFAPNLTISALGAVNRILPEPNGRSLDVHKGFESQTLLTRSPLTLLDQRAARSFNQR